MSHNELINSEEGRSKNSFNRTSPNDVQDRKQTNPKTVSPTENVPVLKLSLLKPTNIIKSIVDFEGVGLNRILNLKPQIYASDFNRALNVWTAKVGKSKTVTCVFELKKSVSKRKSLDKVVRISIIPDLRGCPCKGYIYTSHHPKFDFKPVTENWEIAQPREENEVQSITIDSSLIYKYIKLTFEGTHDSSNTLRMLGLLITMEQSTSTPDITRPPEVKKPRSATPPRTATPTKKLPEHLYLSPERKITESTSRTSSDVQSPKPYSMEDSFLEEYENEIENKLRELEMKEQAAKEEEKRIMKKLEELRRAEKEEEERAKKIAQILHKRELQLKNKEKELLIKQLEQEQREKDEKLKIIKHEMELIKEQFKLERRKSKQNILKQQIVSPGIQASPPVHVSPKVTLSDPSRLTESVINILCDLKMEHPNINLFSNEEYNKVTDRAELESLLRRALGGEGMQDLNSPARQITEEIVESIDEKPKDEKYKEAIHHLLEKRKSQSQLLSGMNITPKQESPVRRESPKIRKSKLLSEPRYKRLIFTAKEQSLASNKKREKAQEPINEKKQIPKKETPTKKQPLVLDLVSPTREKPTPTSQNEKVRALIEQKLDLSKWDKTEHLPAQSPKNLPSIIDMSEIDFPEEKVDAPEEKIDKPEEKTDVPEEKADTSPPKSEHTTDIDLSDEEQLEKLEKMETDNLARELAIKLREKKAEQKRLIEEFEKLKQARRQIPEIITINETDEDFEELIKPVLSPSKEVQTDFQSLQFTPKNLEETFKQAEVKKPQQGKSQSPPPTVVDIMQAEEDFDVTQPQQKETILEQSDEEKAFDTLDLPVQPASIEDLIHPSKKEPQEEELKQEEEMSEEPKAEISEEQKEKQMEEQKDEQKEEQKEEEKEESMEVQKEEQMELKKEQKEELKEEEKEEQKEVKKEEQKKETKENQPPLIVETLEKEEAPIDKPSEEHKITDQTKEEDDGYASDSSVKLEIEEEALTPIKPSVPPQKIEPQTHEDTPANEPPEAQQSLDDSKEEIKKEAKPVTPIVSQISTTPRSDVSSPRSIGSLKRSGSKRKKMRKYNSENRMPDIFRELTKKRLSISEATPPNLEKGDSQNAFDIHKVMEQGECVKPWDIKQEKEDTKEEAQVQETEKGQNEPLVVHEEKIQEQAPLQLEKDEKKEGTEEPKEEIKENVQEKVTEEPKEEIKEQVEESVKEEPKEEPKEEIKEEPKEEIPKEVKVEKDAKEEDVKKEEEIKVEENVIEEIPKEEIKEEPKEAKKDATQLKDLAVPLKLRSILDAPSPSERLAQLTPYIEKELKNSARYQALQKGSTVIRYALTKNKAFPREIKLDKNLQHLIINHKGLFKQTTKIPLSDIQYVIYGPQSQNLNRFKITCPWRVFSVIVKGQKKDSYDFETKTDLECQDWVIGLECLIPNNIVRNLGPFYTKSKIIFKRLFYKYQQQANKQKRCTATVFIEALKKNAPLQIVKDEEDLQS